MSLFLYPTRQCMRKIFMLLIFSGSFLLSTSQSKKQYSEITGKLIYNLPSAKQIGISSSISSIQFPDTSKIYRDKMPQINNKDHGTKSKTDPVVQRKAGHYPQNNTNSLNQSSTGPSIEQSFDGINFIASTPADAVIAVGPNHIVQLVNAGHGPVLSIKDKIGNTLLAPTDVYLLMGLQNYHVETNPRVYYDQFADRFFFTVTGFSADFVDYTNTIYMGISQSSDPTAGWYTYQFTDTTGYVDYSIFGVWPDAYYAVSQDYLNSATYIGSSVYAFDKSKLLAGNTSFTVQRFKIFSSDYNKYLSIVPANFTGTDIPSPTSPGLFFYYHDDNLTSSTTDVDSVGIFSLQPDFTTPANSVLSFPQKIVVAPFKSIVCPTRSCAPTVGTLKYDVMSDRFMTKINYRKFATHESIVATHTVDANYPSTPARSGIRWYEFRKTTGDWFIHQQGTYAPDTAWRFIGSININSKGQIGIGYSSSALGKQASIAFTGRDNGDSASIMTYPETTAQEGYGYGTFASRWGNYIDMVNDPVNDSIFWMVAMYGGSSFTWKTRIISFKLKTQYTQLFNTSICPGGSSIFSTAAIDAAYQYQWQVDTGDNVFIDLIADTVYSSVNTSSLILTQTPSFLSGNKYRCKVTTPIDSFLAETYILKFTSQWIGPATGAWEDVSNWSCGMVPDQFTDIIVPPGNSITINSNAYCKSLFLSTGSTIIVTSGFTLFVNGEPFK